ncbi:probable F-box protein At4g22165 [Brassica napus]|nr:probable F-box protein At4g22165 [Brassica napus]
MKLLHKPNSYKLQRRGDKSKSWSELPQDLINSVLERLDFADSRRAESVCSSWYSAAKRCVAKKQIPWLILLPDEDDKINNHWCKLFNPGEKDKLYKIRDEDVEFANSYCLATYGNWLFMVDYWYNLYLLNIFTHERIDLPPVESQLGTTKLERTLKGWFCISNGHRKRNHKDIIIVSPVFWIDEHTKEYLVLWGFGEWCVAYSKKGDTFWNQIQIPVDYGCSHMVYKDQKLYYLLKDYIGSNGFIKIFDFSGEIPRETFQCGGVPGNISSLDPTGNSWRITNAKLVVTVTGDVLYVENWATLFTSFRVWSFRVYKVYSSGLFNKYEQVDSLGNEAMLFDLGITVLANDDIVGGFKRNSIYYKTTCHEKNTTQICLFNFETKEMEPLHKFDCSSHEQLARSLWFLPSFKQT